MSLPVWEITLHVAAKDKETAEHWLKTVINHLDLTLDLDELYPDEVTGKYCSGHVSDEPKGDASHGNAS